MWCRSCICIIIVRYRDDAAWPRPVWGVAPAQPYSDELLAQRLARARGITGAARFAMGLPDTALTDIVLSCNVVDELRFYRYRRRHRRCRHGLAIATNVSGAARVVLLEKENAVALHQSGRNSGVIHAGVYYAPD